MFHSRLLCTLAIAAFSLGSSAAEIASPPAAAREALAALAQNLKIDARDFVVGRVDVQAPKNPGAGATAYVAYTQTYRGLPVFGSSVRIVVAGGKAVNVRANAYPGIDRSIAPKISLESAIPAIALAGTAPVSVQLGIAPRRKGERADDRLAWRILAPIAFVPDGKGQDAAVQWRYLVDADTREILERVDVIQHDDVSGTVTGSIRPNAPADTPVTVPIRNLQVHVLQGATDQVANTDNAGAYVVSGLAAGTGDLSSTLRSSNFRIENSEITQFPFASRHAATVSVPGTHDWDWTTSDVSPSQVETNAYHHANIVRDWFLRGTPFDVDAAAPSLLPVMVTVRARTGCNSAYSGPSAAFPQSSIFFGGGAPNMCQDSALCSDIIYHEYTHGIVDAVYSGSGVDLASAPQGNAMNEGWADFFAASITGNPLIGGGCSAGRDIDTPDKRYPGDVVADPHQTGRILSGALWDLRAALPAAYVESLAIRAMKRRPTSFQDYLAAMLEEDDNPAFSTDPVAANNDPADGTPNIDAICHAYVDLHGIYHPYCFGHASGPIALLTSPPSSGYTLARTTARLMLIEGTAEAGSASPLSNYRIEFAQETAPTTWKTQGVALTGGGTAPVAAGALGTIDISALADGMYRMRLTVADAAGATAVAKGTFFIDRAIKRGWPQATDQHFARPPAIADIDPAYPGLEIIAAGDPSGLLYAWHADGTMVQGWPVSVGFAPGSTPAAADMDGDGRVKVVIPATYSVYMFNGDGTPVAGWPQTTGGGTDALEGTAALADLDGDGKLEVIVAAGSRIFAWHSDGSSVAGFPVSLPRAVALSAVAVGDVDNDGVPEIFVAADDGQVHAWKNDGTPLPGWPLRFFTGNPLTKSAVAIGDLDGDGAAEVIATANGRIVAWHGDGTLVTGWSRSLPGVLDGSGSMGLADIDGTHSLKIVVPSSGGTLIFQGDGTPFAGWLTPRLAYFPSSPAIADLAGDGRMNIVVQGGASDFDGVPVNKVFALFNDGVAMAGWPKDIAGAGGGSPAIADIDRDGQTDIVAGSDGMFVWSVPGTYDRRGAEWPNFRQGNRRTGAYVPAAGVALLFDVSQSMGWAPDNTMLAPVWNQRITFAKNAAMPFVEELNDFNAGRARLGIATFPQFRLPPANPDPCDSQVVMPMSVINDATRWRAVSFVIPGLSTFGSTPMLAGIRTAARMLEEHRSPALILLTDGDNNCPRYAPLGSPEVTALIARLNADAIRVFSIGFGQPGDPDVTLLQGLADQTTPPGSGASQFYDVTTPGFDPATWDPATALQATYKSILVDALGLQATIDPLGVIDGGARRTHAVNVTPQDRRVSFFVGWKTLQGGRLELTVKSSDGTIVPATASGVRTHAGDTYSIVTVDSSFLRLPGKVSRAVWTLQVDASGVPAGQREPYQYSVIVDSPLRFEPKLDLSRWIAGRVYALNVRLTEAGKPLRAPAEVRVDVTRARESLEHWLARNQVTPAELRRIPERLNGELLSPAQRKALYLQHFRKLEPPREMVRQSFSLHDAGDGIYSARIPVTNGGTYSFHLRAAGRTADGFPFQRDRMMQKLVDEAR